MTEQYLDEVKGAVATLSRVLENWREQKADAAPPNPVGEYTGEFWEACDEFYVAWNFLDVVLGPVIGAATGRASHWYTSSLSCTLPEDV